MPLECHELLVLRLSFQMRFSLDEFTNSIDCTEMKFYIECGVCVWQQICFAHSKTFMESDKSSNPNLHSKLPYVYRKQDFLEENSKFFSSFDSKVVQLSISKTTHSLCSTKPPAALTQTHTHARNYFLLKKHEIRLMNFNLASIALQLPTRYFK